ncbi:MAG TPA: hypothetical protein VF093_08780 [Solirubrobacterales bacterium]
MNAIDTITKIVGVLAAILGTAGYVLVLGAAILWVRLQDVDLPPEVPVSLATREELIAMGAQAVAVWLLLLVALGSLAAWIVTGDPGRRRFGYAEAGLALSVTVATLLALEGDQPWTIAPAAIAVAYVAGGAWRYWPSLDAVTAVVLPVTAGAGLGAALALLNNRNGFATAAGASFIFGVLVLLTPQLQQWRARQEANRHALAQLKAEKAEALKPLADALEKGPGQHRPPAIVWIGRAAAASLALIALGIISVGSQLDHDENFHKALVSLTNGDCIEGTYVVRGADQIVIGHSNVLDHDSEDARIATVPLAEVLEVQVYGASLDGVDLSRDKLCKEHEEEVLVRPIPVKKG